MTFQPSLSTASSSIQPLQAAANADWQRARDFQAAGQAEAALQAYIACVEREPAFYPAYTALGDLLASLCLDEQALAYYSLALQTAPHPADNLDTLLRMGDLYKKARVFDQASACYRMALKIQPQCESALLSLSQVLRQQGDVNEAIAIYDQLLALRPEDISLKLSKALSLPLVYESAADIAQSRASLEAQVAALSALHIQPAADLALQGSPFYLGYQLRNDRAVMETLGTVLQKLLPPAPALAKKALEAGTIRIGIVSRFLAPTHTVGKFMQGVLQQLSRTRFEVLAFSLGREHAYQPTPEEPALRAILLPTDNIQRTAALIAEEAPDVLLYADIGMNITSWCLAAMRLAPVQCVTWGHPVTTGLNTMDYFLSSALIEPEDAQAHYSERLIRFETLPTFYARPSVPPPARREDFGLDANAHAYLCPQSVFKLHPDFDALLGGILARDPDGVVVLLSHYAPEVDARLQARLRQSIPAVADRIVWAPRLAREGFLKLLACADVLLDPPGFGGGNTSYEAFALGVPIVTWPGAFMRGRVTLGCYRQMGLSAGIVDSAAAYVEQAVKLGTDTAARRALSAAILSQNHRLFEDRRFIEALEAFLLDAVQSAASVQ